MSKENTVSVQVGPGFFGTLFIVFLVLKLTGYITWSWWWVTAPLWGPIALCLIGLLVVAIIFLIYVFCAWIGNLIFGRS